MFDYSYLPNKDQVFVHFFFSSGNYLRQELRSKIESFRENYNFMVFIDEHGSELKPTNEQVIDHSIYIIDDIFKEQTVAQITSQIRDNQTISIAFSYPNESTMLMYEKEIEILKSKYQNRVNFLRPDTNLLEQLLVSNQKILDNAVCDSIRIKFDIEKVESSFDLGKREKNFFLQCSKIYDNYQLFHRSDSDGYFAIRVNDGFLITATKTQKTKLDLDRIVFVHSFDQNSNLIHYSGKYLPSSDSVEAAMVFDNLPEVQNIVHVHASSRFTRNPLFRERVTVPPLPYGEIPLGKSLIRALKDSSDGFIIMEEHGEVFAGKNYYFENDLSKIISLCK